MNSVTFPGLKKLPERSLVDFRVKIIVIMNFIKTKYMPNTVPYLVEVSSIPTFLIARYM